MKKNRNRVASVKHYKQTKQLDLTVMIYIRFPFDLTNNATPVLNQDSPIIRPDILDECGMSSLFGSGSETELSPPPSQTFIDEDGFSRILAIVGLQITGLQISL